ncbi:MAG: Crossover junction endonuclease mus81, partial [Paramarteilia canceri]
MLRHIFIGCEYINELSLPCKNPIFLSWLNEFYEDAKKKRFKSAHTIKKAIKSLQSYDQELKTGYECKVLPYFGEGLCSKIDEKIAVFNQKSNFSPQDNDAISTKQSDDNSQSQLSKKTENNEDSFEDGKKDETKPIQFNIKASNLSYHSKHILMNYKKYDYNTLPLKNIRNCFKNTFGTYKFHNLAEKDDNFIASIKQLTQNHLICKTTKNEYSITNIGKSMINQPEFVLEETNKILKCISNNQEKLLDINLNHEISLEKSQEKKIINNFDSKSNDSNKLNQHCENFNGIDDIDLNENRYFDHDQHYGDNFEYNLNSEVYQYSSDEKSIEQNLIGRSNSEVEFIEESSLNSLQSQCQKSIERYQNIENADINERILSIKGNNNDSIIAISDTTNVEKESIVNSIHSPDVCDKNIFRMANKNSNTLKYQFCAEDGTHVEDSTSAFKCS